jgi:hypothetical protein
MLISKEFGVISIGPRIEGGAALIEGLRLVVVELLGQMGILHADLVNLSLHIRDARIFDFEVCLKLLDKPLVVLDKGRILHQICHLEHLSLLILGDVFSQLIFLAILGRWVCSRVQIVKTCELYHKKLDYLWLQIKSYYRSKGLRPLSSH